MNGSVAGLSQKNIIMTEEDFNYELQKETLNDLRHYLCDHLQPERLFPWLQSQNVLSMDDCEQISSRSTTKTKVDKLVNILIRSGPNGLKQLTKAISCSNKTQLFIAKKLKSHFISLKNKPENQYKLAEIKNRRRMQLPEYTKDPVNQYSPPPPYSQMDETSDHLATEPMPQLLEWSFNPASIVPTTASMKSTAHLTTSTGFTNASGGPRQKRHPVTTDWPRCETSEASSSVRTELFENVRPFQSDDFSTNCIPVKPKDAAHSSGEVPPSNYISEQAEKLDTYTMNRVEEICVWRDSQLMTSVLSDQEVVLEKRQAQMRSSIGHRPQEARIPDEHDSTQNCHQQLQQTSTLVKQIHATENLDLPRLNFQDYAEQFDVPQFLNNNMLLSPTSDESINIRLPPGDESIEVSGMID